MKSIEERADKLAGEACRARGYCESAGFVPKPCFGRLTWAHIIKRSQSRAMRWDADNCLCLCVGCHGYLEVRKSLMEELVEHLHPGKMEELLERKRNGKKPDPQAAIDYYRGVA